MSLLQTLKTAVIRLNSDRNTLFDIPVARQKAFLESLPEPKDLVERSYAQYRCQMMLERPILRMMYQAAAMLLLREDAAVTVCHSRTPDTAALTRQADIIITAAGVRSSLTAAHVRPGQTVVDVSVNGDGSALCGDADFAAVEPVVDAITPVPGGVGAVTSSVLMAHTVRAAELLTGEGRL